MYNYIVFIGVICVDEKQIDEVFELLEKAVDIINRD